jgi:hypothetical protein
MMKKMLATAVCAVSLMAGAAQASAADGAGAGSVSGNPTGTVSKDGTITLSGTYRCTAPAGPGPVFVSSSLQSGSVQQGIGGTAATCDGAEHTWTNQEKPSGGSALKPGPATVEVTLVHLDTGSGLPMPAVVAADRHPITLVPANG